MTNNLKNILQNMPTTAGVYQFFNKNETIIYVGKAKNLKKRVISYFNKNHISARTDILVRQIVDIKYIVVENESDALLLENNLIKQLQPRYNVMLKDGKTYPWLCITKEEFPRVFKTRKTFSNAEFFGPYSFVHSLNTLLELIHRIYPLRTCNLPISEKNILKNKYKLCLQYHIKNCKGVCCGLQSKDSYNQMINEIRTIAKGHSNLIIDFLLNQMHILSSEQKFEEAQIVKEKYEAIVKYQSKTIITTLNDDDIDVFAFDKDEQNFYINMLKIVNGSVIQSFTLEMVKKIEETDNDILSTGIMELRNRFESNSKKVIVPFMPDFEINNVEFIVPKLGDKKKLLNLSIKNVKQYKIDKLSQTEKLNHSQKNIMLLKEVQNLLHLPTLPHNIEIFDNSNIAGSEAVAVCVVYKDLKKSQKDYRKFIIKNANAKDDYASMQEVVKRRYSRMIDEGLIAPDLIIADGGKGQMEIIRKVVEDELGLKIPIVGLAKNEKHRTKEVLVGFPTMSVGLKPTSTVFKLFTQMQDEVHRFAITFHRNKRSTNQTKSELDEIKGIGDKTKTLLLKHFKSVKRIKQADIFELEKLIGKAKAKLIKLSNSNN
jgi:excinuclease ABC subunit C